MSLEQYKSKDGFYGFGDPNCPVWFIGIEPGEDNKYNQTRSNVWKNSFDSAPIINARSFHEIMAKTEPNGSWEWFGKDGKYQSTYGSISRLILKASGESFDSKATLEFQRFRFDTLCSLDLFASAYPNRAKSRNNLLDAGERMAGLEKLVLKHKPSLLVFYGRGLRIDEFCLYQRLLNICKPIEEGSRSLLTGSLNFAGSQVKMLFIDHTIRQPIVYRDKIASLIGHAYIKWFTTSSAYNSL